MPWLQPAPSTLRACVLAAEGQALLLFPLDLNLPVPTLPPAWSPSSRPPLGCLRGAAPCFSHFFFLSIKKASISVTFLAEKAADG